MRLLSLSSEVCRTRRYARDVARVERLIANGRMTLEEAANIGSLATQAAQSFRGADLSRLQAYRSFFYQELARQLITKHQNLPKPYVCKFGGAKLEIDEGVFCPTLASASWLLLTAVENDLKPGDRVLDMFAGSGAFGIIAAQHGASSVVTVDISGSAVANTIKNATLNGMSDKVQARQGTIETCLQTGEQFDLVMANPPLLNGEATGPIEAAIYDPDQLATKHLVDQLPNLLAPGGRCYLVTSNVLARQGYDVEAACWESGFWRPEIVAEQNRRTEHYTVYRIDQWPA